MIFTHSNNIIIPQNKITKMNLFFTQKDISNNPVHPIHAIQNEIKHVENKSNINLFRIYKHTKIGILNQNNSNHYQFQNYIHKNKVYSDLKDQIYKNKIKKLKIKEPVKISSWDDCGDRLDEIKEKIRILKIKEPVFQTKWIDW
jgi:hypothetical protein